MTKYYAYTPEGEKKLKEITKKIRKNKLSNFTKIVILMSILLFLYTFLLFALSAFIPVEPTGQVGSGVFEEKINK